MDQDDDGVDFPSLPMEQMMENFGDNEIMVAVTVVEDDVKSGEGSSEDNYETGSICSCQQDSRGRQ